MRTYQNIEDLPGGSPRPLSPLSQKILDLIGGATPGGYFTSNEVHAGLFAEGFDHPAPALGQCLKQLANRGHVTRIGVVKPTYRLVYQVPEATI